MAKYERRINRGIGQVLDAVHNEILHGSATASYEDGSDFSVGAMRAAVRVYERYSMIGGNRLTLTFTAVGDENSTQVSAITSGGSQAMFWKLNTFGEDAFLNRVADMLDRL